MVFSRADWWPMHHLWNHVLLLIEYLPAGYLRNDHRYWLIFDLDIDRKVLWEHKESVYNYQDCWRGSTLNFQSADRVFADHVGLLLFINDDLLQLSGCFWRLQQSFLHFTIFAVRWYDLRLLHIGHWVQYDIWHAFLVHLHFLRGKSGTEHFHGYRRGQLYWGKVQTTLRLASGRRWLFLAWW